MEENSISVIIVNPRNDRLYNYWINGSLEKRCMLKDRMREFCLDLSPKNARDINRCIDDMIPFVVYVDQKVFQELKEEDPPKISKANKFFPLRKKIYSRENVKVKEDKDFIEEQKHKFNIWEKYSVRVEHKKTNFLKGRKL